MTNMVINQDYEYNKYFYCVLNDIFTSNKINGSFVLHGIYPEKRGAILNFICCKICGEFVYISKNNSLYPNKIYCKCKRKCRDSHNHKEKYNFKDEILDCINLLVNLKI